MQTGLANEVHMTINFAHLRERSVQGGWINFVVFEADANNRTSTARAMVLADLTRRARALRLKVDQAALAFVENGRLHYYGTPNLVDYLSKNGPPRWTHRLSS